jgi:hypothetical protein
VQQQEVHPRHLLLKNKGEKQGNKTMKKIMIAAAAAMLGIVANAASIQWGATVNFAAEDGTVYTAATAPAGSLVLVYLGSGTADWDAATVVNEGTVAYTVSMGSPTAKASGTFNFAANT